MSTTAATKPVQTKSTTPPLIAQLSIIEPVLNSEIGYMMDGFHVHTIDDTLDISYTEAVIGTAYQRPVRIIRSHPDRPIADGPKTNPGLIDHIGIDFLNDPLPTIEQFDRLAQLFPNAKTVMQSQPHCSGIRVERKIWVYDKNYPPLEIQLGPKTECDSACNPRPDWPS